MKGALYGFALTLFALHAPIGGTPSIELINSSLDVPVYDAGEMAHPRIDLLNKGEEEIRLVAIRVKGCGCGAIQNDEGYLLLPHQKESVTLSIDTSGYNPGTGSWELEAIDEDGNIIPVAGAQDYLVAKRVLLDKTPEEKSRAYRKAPFSLTYSLTTDTSLAIQRIVARFQGQEQEVSYKGKEQRKSGEFLLYEIRLNGQLPDKLGIYRDEGVLSIYCDSSECKQFPLPVLLNVTDLISPSPARTFLGVVRQGDKITKSITFSSQTDEPVSILQSQNVPSWLRLQTTTRNINGTDVVADLEFQVALIPEESGEFELCFKARNGKNEVAVPVHIAYVVLKKAL